MLIAVSILSPVRTHTLIFAIFKKLMVSARSSYNLSSMAVDPSKLKSYSIISATYPTFSSLLCVETKAY
jgi:hypothetical protein